MSEQPEKDFKFDKMASRYDEGFVGKASQRFYNLLVDEADFQPGAAVLDVGCGTGELLRRLSSRYGICGSGIDMEPNMVAVAAAKSPDMHFWVGSCDSIQAEDSSFDAIVCCMAYHHFGNKEGFAREAARVLPQGGTLVIADPHFPLVVRSALNRFFRLVRIVGAFCSPEEMASQFDRFGFELTKSRTDGYAQLVVLRKR